MAKIIISHDEKAWGKNWKALNNQDIKKTIEEMWKNRIKGTVHYTHLQKILNNEINCSCEYPLSRPVSDLIFKNYHGCIFDLDAYCEGSEKSCVIKEVKSLPNNVYAGGISKKPKKYTSASIPTNWFEKPIENAGKLEEYLTIICMLLRAEFDKKFKKTLEKANKKLG